MFYDIFVQVLGFIAIAMNLIAVQFNSHGKIMLFKSLGSLLFCLQYLFLGAYAGMVMDLIGTTRNIVFAHNVKKDRSNKWYIILFSIITVVLGILTIIFTWDKSIQAVSRWSTDIKTATIFAVSVSIISIIAKLLTTIAYGFKNPHAIRMTNLPSCSLWIIYNIVAFSLAGIVNEVMSIISIVIAELRFKNVAKSSENSKND